MRTALNRWMRDTAGTARGYDAVADVDTALADPANPRTLRPAYNSGDGVHPNNAGYRRIADTIPLARL